MWIKIGNEVTRCLFLRNYICGCILAFCEELHKVKSFEFIAVRND
jgi:hypothetical protein